MLTTTSLTFASGMYRMRVRSCFVRRRRRGRRPKGYHLAPRLRPWTDIRIMQRREGSRDHAGDDELPG